MAILRALHEAAREDQWALLNFPYRDLDKRDLGGARSTTRKATT